MDYIGIDLSLTATGVIMLNEKSEVILSKLISTKSTESIELRIDKIGNEIIKIIQESSTNSITYIENLSFGSKGDAYAQLCGLHYYVRILMNNKNLIYKVISPTTLKKFITGKGNIKKNLMLLQIYKKFGIEFDNDNLADSFGLAMMAYEENKWQKKL